jgi:hypothetical protein
VQTQDGVSQVARGTQKGNAHTDGTTSSIGSRRGLLAGGGLELDVGEKRARIHARPGEVNGGGHDSCRTGKRRRCCTHQPTANGERERGSLSVSRFNGEEGNRKKRWVFRKPSDLFFTLFTLF